MLTLFLYPEFVWGVSLRHPVLASFFYRGSFSYISYAGFILSVEFLLQIPLFFSFFVRGIYLAHPIVASFYAVSFIFIWEVSLTNPVLALILSGDSLTYPILVSFLSGEFLVQIPCCLHFVCLNCVWHIPCCLNFYPVSLSYTSQAAFIFMWGVSLTHPMLQSLKKRTWWKLAQENLV